MIALRTSAHEELWGRVGGRRIVGTVNLRVAIQAATALPDGDRVLAASGARELARNRAIAGLSVRRMALLAQQGRARLEHGWNRRAVSVVAVGAVFRDWFMRMYERAALFSMAGVAGVVDAVALDQLGAGRSMRIMTIRAAHLALWHRVVRRPVHLCALFLVAGVADIGLGGLGQHLVAVGVDLVAGIAGNVSGIVLAASPQRALGILVVASQAGRAALVRRRGRLLGEHPVGMGPLGNTGWPAVVRMRVTGAMAARAGRRARVASVTHWTTCQCGGSCRHRWRFGTLCMRGPAHVWQVFFVVAGHAQRRPNGLGAPG